MTNQVSCGHGGADGGHRRCGFVPPYVLRQIAEAEGPSLADMDTARFDGVSRTQRNLDPDVLRGGSIDSRGTEEIRVHDMGQAEDPLPGRLVRSTVSDAATGDPIADAAFENAVVVQAFYADVFGQTSITGVGDALVSSVHYGHEINNAFWNGSQMVYGNGDGRNLLPFALSLEVVAHELSHAVMSAASNLFYHGESGALNESFCDVMASLVVQRHRDQDVETADWIIGREVVGPELGVAGFRSFTAEPAYRDHPTLDDPQPKHFSDFVNTASDDGGVHINVGIANHAYYLAAKALGGRAWERAGRIWYDAFMHLPTHATFVDAAEATVRVAGQLFGNKSEEQRAFREGWKGVGVAVAN